MPASTCIVASVKVVAPSGEEVELLPMLLSIVSEERWKSTVHVDYEDIVSIGLLQLTEAVESYDPSYGSKFSTYAYNKVKYGILDELRRSQVYASRFMSQEKFPEVPQSGHSREIETAQLLHKILYMVYQLPDLDRLLVQRHYLSGISFELLGREIGKRPSWVSGKVADAVAAIRQVFYVSGGKGKRPWVTD